MLVESHDSIRNQHIKSSYHMILCNRISNPFAYFIFKKTTPIIAIISLRNIPQVINPCHTAATRRNLGTLPVLCFPGDTVCSVFFSTVSTQPACGLPTGCGSIQRLLWWSSLWSMHLKLGRVGPFLGTEIMFCTVVGCSGNLGSIDYRCICIVFSVWFIGVYLCNYPRILWNTSVSNS